MTLVGKSDQFLSFMLETEVTLINSKFVLG